MIKSVVSNQTLFQVRGSQPLPNTRRREDGRLRIPPGAQRGFGSRKVSTREVSGVVHDEETTSPRDSALPLPSRR